MNGFIGDAVETQRDMAVMCGMIIPRPSFKHLPLFLALSAACLCNALSALPEPKGERAVFEITPEVVVKNPVRFGVNAGVHSMSHFGTEPWHNQWWLAPNIEPFTARHRRIVTAGGEDFFEDNDKGMGLGYYDIFRTGFFDGGTALIYRFDGQKLNLVRESKIKTYEAQKDGVNRVTFTERGPAVQEGDYYFITVERTDIPSSVTRTYEAAPWDFLQGFRLPNKEEKKFHEAGVRLEIVPDVPPDNGRASLKMTIPEGLEEMPRLGYWLLSKERDDNPRLREGATYTVKMWLKQEGPAPRDVEVRVGSMADHNFSVGNEWQEYSFDFIGAPPKWSVERFDIGSKAPGALYIDSVTIVEKDGPPPFEFYPEIVDTLKRFRPGSMRLWALFSTGMNKRLDDALGPPAQSNLAFFEQGGAATSTPVGLHKELELCEKVGSDPWIITSLMCTPEENKNLIEYLAGPADSPYGAKRAAWGREKPWTEAFDRIILETGNEAWNSMFKPQNFGAQPKLYGAYSEFIFQTMKSSPYFAADKFFLVVNGWVAQPGPKGYGAEALRMAPMANAFDIAYYTGGWDAVGQMKADNEAEGWLNVLTFSRRMLLSRSREAVEAANQIGLERGRPASVLVYEAGPGYTLPGPGKFNMKEQEEGKSLAQAITSLDIFMANIRIGVLDQAFYMFKNGHYWASHNRKWGEHIVWKALGMRNSLCEGDLITANAKEMVTIDLPDAEVDILHQSNSADRKLRTLPGVPDLPLVDCYPFQKDKRHSFMFISRRLEGSTPVTLELPYEPEDSYTLHTLAGDSPAVHNIEEEVVKVVTAEKKGMTKSFTLQIPPHSVVVLVNNAK